MNRFSPFITAWRKGLSRLFPSNGGSGLSGYGGYGGFGLWPFLPGASYDYRTEAGALWENSIVLAGINWISTTLPEAKLGIAEPGGHAFDFAHPAVRLVQRPNPDAAGNDLWPGTILSLVVDGNAYWRKVRSRSGKVMELWNVPYYRIEPVWPDDGSKFIAGYRMRVNGKDIIFPKNDIVHFRNPVPDPMNERKGIAPLKAALREICIDNESATFTAALLRNSGIPGALLSPEGTSNEGRELIFEQRQREDLVALWKSKFTGDHRGEPFVSPIPMKVQPFSFNPQQMLVDRVTDRPEERICALLNLPPVVLGLGTGLRNSNNRASYGESRRAAYESNIIPTQDHLARQLSAQLLPDFEADESNLAFGWDRSGIEILRESEDSRFARATQAFAAGIMTREEARELLGIRN